MQLDLTRDAEGLLRRNGRTLAAVFAGDVAPCVGALAFDPDGTRLVVGLGPGLLVYELATRRLRDVHWLAPSGDLEGVPLVASALSVGPAGTYLVAAAHDWWSNSESFGIVQVFAEGQSAPRLVVPDDRGSDGAEDLFGCGAWTLSPDGYWLAVDRTRDGVLEVWHLPSMRRHEATHTRPIRALAFDAPGRRLAIADGTGVVVVDVPGGATRGAASRLARGTLEGPMVLADRTLAAIATIPRPGAAPRNIGGVGTRPRRGRIHGFAARRAAPSRARRKQPG